MLEKEFIEKLTEMMDTEANLSMDTELAEIEEWDSLSYVAFLAMASTVPNKKVMPADVKAAKQVRDLYELLFGEV